MDENLKIIACQDYTRSWFELWKKNKKLYIEKFDAGH